MSAESKKSILLVDDEPLTCESFQALLTKFGYQVRPQVALRRAMPAPKATGFLSFWWI